MPRDTRTHTCSPAMRAWMAFLLFCHGDTVVAVVQEPESTILARHARKGLRACGEQLHKSLMSPERRALKILGLGGSIRTLDVGVACTVNACQDGNEDSLLSSRLYLQSQFVKT